jgi:hypothetical protein
VQPLCHDFTSPSNLHRGIKTRDGVQRDEPLRERTSLENRIEAKRKERATNRRAREEARSGLIVDSFQSLHADTEAGIHDASALFLEACGSPHLPHLTLEAPQSESSRLPPSSLLMIKVQRDHRCPAEDRLLNSHRRIHVRADLPIARSHNPALPWLVLRPVDGITGHANYKYRHADLFDVKHKKAASEVPVNSCPPSPLLLPSALFGSCPCSRPCCYFLLCLLVLDLTSSTRISQPPILLGPCQEGLGSSE